MEHINIGIDLGTTNSGIGRYENGKVQVLKNPVGLKEILPSVVSFRKGRIIVGDKAREQYLTNAENVFSAFKRRIGTSENYWVKQENESSEITPVDLSAYVLKELSNYLHNEKDSVVITIPASFDTIQSNATKQAGYQAGFKEVVLLQEPIAACLAYANVSHINIEKEQKWLVYDFGGGTFDTALIYINQRELKVIDNKGNNFLGGVDIDHAFIREVIVPKLSEITGNVELWDKIALKQGVYEKFWHYLNYIGEEVKKQLSLTQTAWLEVDFAELDIMTEFEISREDLNTVVRPKYLETEKFILELLSENDVTFSDIERIILVGGTTYIPFIKDELKRISQSIVDDTVDPTTAVIVGAAYYAGAHPKAVTVKTVADEQAPKLHREDVKISYEPYTNDIEELIAFKINDQFKGLYRISRNDGGFDTGLIGFSESGSEFVTLIPKAKNIFRLRIYDAEEKEIYDNADINISHGLYNVSGQLLPADICIELDNNDDTTYLEVVFKRNSILPLKKTLYKTFTKSIIVNSDDKIVINLVEGKGGTMPGANLSIGYIELSGKTIHSDLIQGTDIEIKVNMDESRGLYVMIYIPATEEEIERSFHIASRDVNCEKILYDITQAEALLAKEIAISNKEEAYEVSAMFSNIEQELSDLRKTAEELFGDNLTVEKYRIDERKRKLLGELDSLTRARDVYAVLNEYKELKTDFISQEKYATPELINKYKLITTRENEFLKSNDKHLIKKMNDELRSVNIKVHEQNPEFFVRVFLSLRFMPLTQYKSGNVEELFQMGNNFIMEKNYEQLRPIVYVLYGMLKEEFKSRREEHFQQLQNVKFSKMGLK